MAILIGTLGVLAVILWTAPAADAGPIGLGGPWLEFVFLEAGVPATGCFPADPAGLSCTPSAGGNSIFADAPPYTFVAPAGGAIVTVVDAFCRGGAFSVFDFGGLIGTTPVVPTVCGAPGETTDPAVAVLDPTYSSGVFFLAQGPHEISFSALVSPFGAGAAYFRVDPKQVTKVAEPASWFLLGTGLVLSGLRGRRLRRNPPV
jgi:hypothetical protein